MSLICRGITVAMANKTLLNGVSAEFESGVLTVLIGPNGAGKSTLLRILSGQLKAAEGDIEINGQPLRDYGLAELAHQRCVMTQSSKIAFDFSVKEIMLFGWLDSQRVQWGVFDEVARLCRVQDMLYRRFNTLSGGEQQRVHFARTLVQLRSSNHQGGDQFILLDEPTASLDIAHALHLLSLVKRVVSEGVGAVVVLHDLNLAARLADKLILLESGIVVDQGRVGDVMNGDTLSRVYKTQIRVEHHSELGRLVVHT